MNTIDRINDAYHCQAGESARRIAAEGVSITGILLAKNQDYGGSAWQVPALAPLLDPGTAILVRMSDKIARLKQLLAHGSTAQVDESIEDTLRDLAGYCVLWLARPKSPADLAAESVPAKAPEPSAFTAMTKAKCDTCEHHLVGCDKEPCLSCDGDSMWQLSNPTKEIAEQVSKVTDVEPAAEKATRRRCINCVSYDSPSCAVCSDMSRFVPRS